MGASVTVYWPGITEEQIEEEPGFYNDDAAWADWRAEIEEDAQVLQVLTALGVTPILTIMTMGMSEDDVDWVTPQQLQEAARILRDAVQQRRPGIDHIIEVYERSANNIRPLSEEFIRDLEDIEALARWAQGKGTTKVTLEVNW